MFFWGLLPASSDDLWAVSSLRFEISWLIMGSLTFMAEGGARPVTSSFRLI